MGPELTVPATNGVGRGSAGRHRTASKTRPSSRNPGAEAASCLLSLPPPEARAPSWLARAWHAGSSRSTPLPPCLGPAAPAWWMPFPSYGCSAVQARPHPASKEPSEARPLRGPGLALSVSTARCPLQGTCGPTGRVDFGTATRLGPNSSPPTSWPPCPSPHCQLAGSQAPPLAGPQGRLRGDAAGAGCRHTYLARSRGCWLPPPLASSLAPDAPTPQGLLGKWGPAAAEGVEG